MSEYRSVSPKYPANRPRSYQVIEKEARHTRQVLGFDYSDRLEGLGVFENINKYRVLIGQREYRIAPDVVDDLPYGTEAEARFDGREFVLALSERSYEDLEQGRLGRPRFTLSHEIGHIVLHSAELIRLSKMPTQHAAMMRGRSQDLPVYRDAEWQANAFGAALLVPAAGLEKLSQVGSLTERHVARQFGVSTQCARIRIKVFAKKRADLLSA